MTFRVEKIGGGRGWITVEVEFISACHTADTPWVGFERSEVTNECSAAKLIAQGLFPDIFVGTAEEGIKCFFLTVFVVDVVDGRMEKCV